MISHSLMTRTPNVSIRIDGKNLDQLHEVKFLGITLDKNLRWKPHIEILKTKLSRVTGTIYRIRDYVDKDSLRQIYLSLAYPHLLYCCALCGGAYKTFIDNLFVEQKKLIRTNVAQPTLRPLTSPLS